MSDDLHLIERSRSDRDRVAMVAAEGMFTYGDLLDASLAMASKLLDVAGCTGGDLGAARVCYMVPPGFAYAATQWGIWRAGAVAVPMALSHPPAELAYVLDDAQPSIIVGNESHAATLRPLALERGLPLLLTSDVLELGKDARGAGGSSIAVQGDLPSIDGDRPAMMIYTSGTTNRPKGVVTTHANIEAQVRALVEAWEWTADDRILLVLPLHHIHGIINVLTCALWSGARCTILPRFDAAAVWREIAEGDLTLFMAVPTIYSRLIALWDQADDAGRRRMSQGCRQLRLMVSGSAALPVSTLEKWREISGHTLLERYGMTEIGMALSNPLRGTRYPGHVGLPLPGVDVRLVDESGRAVPDGDPGEIQVRGASVFREYWRRPEATAAAFDGRWFRTGDIAALERVADDERSYRVLGRQSVDIIKTGGYKVSALEIEEVLRTHPEVADCAVVGVEDSEWGERVAVALVRKDGTSDSLRGERRVERLRTWAEEWLAPYKIPSLVEVVAELPRNAMGKVVKPDIKRLFH